MTRSQKEKKHAKRFAYWNVAKSKPLRLAVDELFDSGMVLYRQNNDADDVLKIDRRTCVTHVMAHDFPVIIKTYRMNRFKDSLHHKRYAFSEFQNNLKAAQRGIPVPKCYAYFEKREYGLVKQCGVVMQAIDELTPFKVLLDAGEASQFDIIPLMKKLYESGVNHYDLSPSNIFYRAGTSDFSVIDWQYSSFFSPRQDLQMCLTAAIFLHYTNTNPLSAVGTEWLSVLYKTCAPGISFELMTSAVYAMRDRHKLHWRDGLKLDADKLGLKNIWSKK